MAAVMHANVSSPQVEWATAGAALDGDVSGDLHVVVPLADTLLVAVVDGLGHGPPAALAAREAAHILDASAALPLEELLARCHEGLRSTRGAVVSLASLDFRSSTLEWCGVGNVEGVLLRADPRGNATCHALVSRGGVVGYRLPPLKVSQHSISKGDVLLLATDGIRSGFSEGIDLEAEPQRIADSVMAAHAKGSDDALVLVLRYLGRASHG